MSKEPNSEYLISIRKGKHDLKTLLNKCEEDLKRMSELFLNSSLPDKIDKKQVEELIKGIKQEFYNQNQQSDK